MVFGIAGQEAEVVSARGRGGQGAVGGSGEKEAMVVASRSKVAIAGVSALQRIISSPSMRKQTLPGSSVEL